jgi:2-polyprenyl-3-methyl-5-hydroxy-6-metoxy-1,4-benzoquinol methylase
VISGSSTSIDVAAVLERLGYARADALGIHTKGTEGYWSNLSRPANARLLDTAARVGAREAVRREMPHLFDIVYSSKREAGLELLDIAPGMICIDYGCMWGALSAGASRRGANVIAVDQTYESLAFFAARKQEDDLENVTLVQDDIRSTRFEDLADRAIVNGVLEWVPEVGEIALEAYYGKRQFRRKSETGPREQQLAFLKTTQRALRPGGRLFLAIENRFDYTQFLGKRDPHSNLWLTSIAPRWLANLISEACLSRPYVNYLYSFAALRRLIRSAGFSSVEMHMCFPNYRFPELLIPFDDDAKMYRPYEVLGGSWRRRVVQRIERIIMATPGGRLVAPSIIAVATK